MKINTSFITVKLLLLRSGRSEPTVSLVQDDAKDQEPSGMMIFIIEGWDKYKMSLELHLERENEQFWWKKTFFCISAKSSTGQSVVDSPLLEESLGDTGDELEATVGGDLLADPVGDEVLAKSLH